MPDGYITLRLEANLYGASPSTEIILKHEYRTDDKRFLDDIEAMLTHGAKTVLEEFNKFMKDDG